MSDDRQNVVDMAGTRVDDDHLLSMYVDNELDAEQTIALVSRLRNERSLRARLEVMEANDQRVRALFAESNNHVPEHLAPMVAAENVSTGYDSALAALGERRGSCLVCHSNGIGGRPDPNRCV